jgi:hypothetical protein
METQVYKIYLAKMTMDAVQLPSERRQEIREKAITVLKDAGGRSLIQGTVFSTELFRNFGVEWYPNWKALSEHERCLDELALFQFIQSQTFIGVEHPDFPIDLAPRELDPDIDYIAQIYFQRYLPAAYDRTEAELADAMETFERAQAMGIIGLMDVYSQPVSREWHWWGVSLYSSMELLVEHTRLLQAHKWWKYYQSHTVLATPEGGELLKK